MRIYTLAEMSKSDLNSSCWTSWRSSVPERITAWFTCGAWRGHTASSFLCLSTCCSLLNRISHVSLVSSFKPSLTLSTLTKDEKVNVSDNHYRVTMEQFPVLKGSYIVCTDTAEQWENSSESVYVCSSLTVLIIQTFMKLIRLWCERSTSKSYSLNLFPSGFYSTKHFLHQTLVTHIYTYKLRFFKCVIWLNMCMVRVYPVHTHISTPYCP